MKTKITLLLLAFFMFVSNSYSQGTFDGDYCPGPGVSGDEYLGQLTTGPLNNSGGTCEISQIWAKVDNLNASLRLAFKIGNAGTALIRLYIDTDNNSTSGLITDASFGSGPAAGGAEYILQINTNSGATKLFQAASSTTVTEINLVPGGLSGLNGDSNGCVGGDKVFVEFYIPFESIGYNPCNTTQPGTINVARYASVSGGSTNSSMCTSQSLNFGVPLSGSVTPNQSICQGTSSSTLTLTINGGINTTIESWQSSTDGVTYSDIFGTAGLYTYTPGILSVGDHYYRARILNTGICINAFYSSAAKITVNAAPTAPNSTGDITECEKSPIQTLNANTALSSTTGITWYDAATGGNIVTSPTINSVGSTTYYAQYSNGTCSSLARTMVTLTITGTPTAPISSGDISECEKSPIQTLNANSALSSTSGITWYDAATGGNLVASPTINTVGTKTYYAQYSNGACSSLTRTAVKLTITGAPSAPASSGNITQCELSPIQTLNANSALSSTTGVTWYDAAIGGNIVASPIRNTVGTTTYFAQFSNGTCSSLARTAVILTITGAPNAPGSSGNITQCELSPIQTLNANSALSSTTGVTWYDAATGGNIVVSPTRNTVGATTYFAQFSNGTCSSLARTAVTLTITGAPSAPASSGNITQCELSPIQTLNANSALSSTSGITWYDAATGGNLVASPTINTIGTKTYYAQYSNGTCLSLTRTAVKLTITGAPSAPASSGNITQCEMSPIQTLNANSALPSTTGVTWYDAAIGGNIVASPTRNTVGATTYFAQYTNGTCSSLTRTAVTLTITGAPNAPASGGNKAECKASPTQTLTATATAPTGFSIIWYDAATGGNVVTSPTWSSVGVKTYYAEAVNNTTSCKSNTRTAVRLEIYPAIIANAIGESLSCAGDSDGNITLTVQGGTAPFNYSWKKTGDNITVVSTAQNPSGLSAGSYNVLITDSKQCTTTASATIIDGDGTAPVISQLPGNTTIECPNLPAFTTATASDSVDPNPTLSFNDVTTPGVCPSKYSITRTWTAKDACGNTSTKTQTITVQDTTAPVLAAAPENVTIECIDDLPPMVSLAYTDNCDAPGTQTGSDASQVGNNCGGTITRTWNVSDKCGNPALTRTQIIKIKDSTAPVLAAAPENITIECIDELPPMVSLAYTDNCDAPGTQIGSDASQVGNNCGGTITRTWNVSDKCGNPALTRTQIITIKDTTAPVLAAAPENVTIECIDELPPMVSLAYTDNCDAPGTQIGSDASQVGNNCGGTITRTWNVSDKCGNPAITRTQIITIKDTTAPVLAAAPENVTIECIDDLPPMVSLAYTDNCDTSGTQTGSDASQVGDNCGGTITRTWNVSDKCGNPAITRTQIITIKDTTAPVLAAAPENVTIECIDDLPPMVSLAYTDNCDTSGTQTGSDASQVGNNCGGTITRTWNVSDKCGNPAITRTQIITIKDTKVPDITTQATSIIVECDGSGNQTAIANWLATNGGAVASDNCSEVKWTNNFDALSNDCSTAVTVLFTATDICGNSSSTPATFSVNDTTKPAFAEEVLPANITVECSAVPIAATLTATDDCSSASVRFFETSAAGTCPGDYILTRTWTATDACNNSITHVQTITVQDNTNPTFVEEVPPATVIAECNNIPAAVTLTATDNCGTAIVTYTEVKSNVSETCASNYTLTRTWTATDACGLTTSHTQIIKVQDTTPPTFVEEVLPVDVIAECNNIPVAVTLTATDNCGTAIVTYAEAKSNASETCASNYTLTRTWSATDACGLTTIHTQIIKVQDTTPPTFVEEVLPVDAIAECNNIPVAMTLTATDNCGAAIVTYAEAKSNVSETCASNYTLTRTWTATDACGLTTVHTQIIKVQDTTPPTFVEEVLPVDAIAECNNIPAAATLTATDNCGTAIVTYTEVKSNVSETCASNYTLTRTWTATDACGLTTTHTQIIKVQDTTPPTFVEEALPVDVIAECNNIPAVVTLTATDNCGTAIVTYAEVKMNVSEACANNYTLTRTWTATDLCGLTATHIQKVTVQDTTKPVIAALPAPSTITCPASPAFAVATATDACESEITLTWADVLTPGVCAGSYSVTRTWTAKDACGNASTASQTINVQDTTGPTTTTAFAPSIDVLCDAIPAKPELVFVDNCSTVNTPVYTEKIINQTPSSYSIEREWNVADACGNTSKFVQLVNVTIANTGIVIPSEACNADSTPIDLNTLLPAGTPTNGVWINQDNIGILQGSIFYPLDAALGDHIFEYKVTEGSCPLDIKVNMNVNFDCKVLGCEAIVVHKAFTPNGDGINEQLVIDGVEDTICYPTGISVEIYNRWGILVFETTKYDNTTNAFEGYSKGRTTISQSDGLPTGTYFYIVNYESFDTNGNIQMNKKDGFLYLSR
jgi:gliding motility-associated-like protein